MKNYELRITNHRLQIIKCLCVFCILGGAVFSVKGQSTNQSYPTPITVNEINGRIPARDLGDARLTAYFYTFDGSQGDIFINVVTTNLDGDIDVFTADNLRPLTKITVYSDASINETGRVIYLRQPVKLILRIEGRTPNDDAATFKIKFAGSFIPAPAVAENPEFETPEVKSDNQTDVRVNSVGTIIEIKPKPIPPPKEVIAKKPEKKTEKIAKAKKQTQENPVAEPEKDESESSEKQSEDKVSITVDKNQTENKAVEKPEEVNPTVVVTDEIAKEKDTKIIIESDKNTPEEAQPNNENANSAKVENPVKTTKESKKPKVVKPLPPSALENIQLIVLFKDGSKIERPMSEVLKFGVDKGILTIITKDGAIGRYSILEVEKMTIE